RCARGLAKRDELDGMLELLVGTTVAQDQPSARAQRRDTNPARVATVEPRRVEHGPARFVPGLAMGSVIAGSRYASSGERPGFGDLNLDGAGARRVRGRR